MNAADRLALLREISEAAQQSPSPVSRVDIDRIHFPADSVQFAKTRFTGTLVSHEDLGVGAIEGLNVDLRYGDWQIFFDRQDFLDNLTQERLSADVAILNFRGGEYLFVAATKWRECTWLRNLEAYIRLRSMLPKMNEVVAYHNSTRREMVLLSPKRGTLLLRYTRVALDVPEAPDFMEVVDELAQTAESLEFGIFFRDETVASLEPTSAINQDSFDRFYLNLPSILAAAKRDYEVYRTQFSFNQLRENFRTERENYFKRIRENSQGLVSQMLALPISAVASTAALVAFKDSNLTYAVVIVYQLVSLYMTSQLSLYASELLLVRRDFENDCTAIGVRSGVLSTAFEQEFENVRVRLAFAQRTLYFTGFAIIGVAVYVVFAQQQLARSNPVFVTLALMFSAVLHIAVFFMGYANFGAEAKKSR